jgi:hypothetical protein
VLVQPEMERGRFPLVVCHANHGDCIAMTNSPFSTGKLIVTPVGSMFNGT